MSLHHAATAAPAVRIAAITMVTTALVAARVTTGAAASPSATGLSDPFGPARNGAVVYAVDGDIWAAESSGANAAAIVSGPDNEDGPAFSRDGTRIAFMRGSADGSARLMVAQADGNGVLPLTGPVDDADWYDWSADGSQLALWHTVDGVPTISIVATDGSGARTLDLGDIEPGDRVDWRPPDGHELVFTGHAKTGPPLMGLYAIAPDGTGLRTIGAVSTSDAWFNDFQLSADGATVAYWAWGPNDAGVSDGYAHLRELVTGADHRLQVRPQAEAEIDPQFSADGSLVVVEAQSESEDRSQLVVGPVDGSRPGVAIGPTFSYKDDDVFAFSPDGTKLILTVNGSTSIIDIATGETTALPGITSYPSWQRLPPA